MAVGDLLQIVIEKLLEELQNAVPFFLKAKHVKNDESVSPFFYLFSVNGCRV